MRVLEFSGIRTLAAARLLLTVMLTWRESLLPPASCLLPSPQLNPMISHFRALPSAPLALHCTAPLLLHSSPPPPPRLHLYPSFFPFSTRPPASECHTPTHRPAHARAHIQSFTRSLSVTYTFACTHTHTHTHTHTRAHGHTAKAAPLDNLK